MSFNQIWSCWDKDIFLKGDLAKRSAAHVMDSIGKKQMQLKKKEINFFFLDKTDISDCGDSGLGG